ncbi:unnamed protein product [Phytophthora fragariaefolia]|uniref:Unnamed protein product n=1 Tax=Phytophthora fragariaefolia TaxID=1490495 RepID=A0A9W6Y8S0_9STRA|nr:unnamed protein product [Phytophthora fragariaefolia]
MTNMKDTFDPFYDNVLFFDCYKIDNKCWVDQESLQSIIDHMNGITAKIDELKASYSNESTLAYLAALRIIATDELHLKQALMGSLTRFIKRATSSDDYATRSVISKDLQVVPIVEWRHTVLDMNVREKPNFGIIIFSDLQDYTDRLDDLMTSGNKRKAKRNTKRKIKQSLMSAVYRS